MHLVSQNGAPCVEGDDGNEQGGGDVFEGQPLAPVRVSRNQQKKQTEAKAGIGRETART
jgi:hypothetical protein